MCIVAPGHVVELDGATATVEVDGRRRQASTLLEPDVLVGDWVVISAGTVIRVLDPEEANEIRTMLDEAARAEAASGRVAPRVGGDTEGS